MRGGEGPRETTRDNARQREITRDNAKHGAKLRTATEIHRTAGLRSVWRLRSEAFVTGGVCHRRRLGELEDRVLRTASRSLMALSGVKEPHDAQASH